MVEIVKHPYWAIDRLLGEKITFPNYDNGESGLSNLTFADIMASQTGGELNWDVISNIRHSWKGKLVLKGVLSKSDAQSAKKIGVDAVIISNHGGRQLNSAPAPIKILPSFIKEGLEKDFLMLDSGIRHGEDIIASLACGASFVFVGRPFLYALAASGSEGVENLFCLLVKEIAIAMSLLGVNSPIEISEKHYLIEGNSTMGESVYLGANSQI